MAKVGSCDNVFAFACSLLCLKGPDHMYEICKLLIKSLLLLATKFC